MASIKNLTATFVTDKQSYLIQTLAEETANSYRPYDPGQYLYKLVIDFKDRTIHLDKFIELTYTTLIAWNMNQRGAKLIKYDIYKQSLQTHNETIESLKAFRIETLSDTDVLNLKEKIKYLFDNLELVEEGKPKLVTFSKTLHYFLPNLLMPVDRRYTLKFFYNKTDTPKDRSTHFEIYWDIFKQFRELATTYDFNKHVADSWNRNVPKLIDNIIIGHIRKQEENKPKKTTRKKELLPVT
jgi:hypothetical protein